MTAFQEEEEKVKYCFIINPQAGKGGANAELQISIREICERKNAEYDIFLSENVDATKKYILDTVLESRCVTFFACGGDGTVCKTASAILSLPKEQRENVYLGIIPMGTGNDFVSNFEDKKLFRDVEAQLDGTPHKIDVFKCNDIYSVNMVNIGFDSHVVRKKEQIGKKAWVPRKLAYIISLVITLVRKPGVKMTFSADGGEASERDLLLATFANGTFCGGGFHSNPTASLFDRAIDCIEVKNIGRIRFLTMVGRYKKGTHLVRKYENIIDHFKCREAHIHMDEATPVSIDGEIMMLNDVHLGVDVAALTIVFPKGVTVIPEMAESEEKYEVKL